MEGFKRNGEKEGRQNIKAMGNEKKFWMNEKGNMK